jgi:hypothetical protein
VRSIKLVNVDAGARTARLWQDGSADVNTILPTTTLDGGGHGEWDGSMILEAADTIQGQADGASLVVCTGYGLELS